MADRDSEEASHTSVLVLNLGGMAIVLVTTWIAWLIIPLLGIDLSKMSLFISSRTLLLSVFLVMALPLSIFGEYWLSRWKKRRFLWKNTLLIIGAFSLFILVTTFLLTVSAMLLSGLPWFWQLPLVAVSSLTGLFIMAMAIRNEKFRKWRKGLGW